MVVVLAAARAGLLHAGAADLGGNNLIAETFESGEGKKEVIDGRSVTEWETDLSSYNRKTTNFE